MNAPITSPLGWLALDIETAGGRPEDAEAWMRRQWAPSDKWKPETIGARYLEMLAKKRERLALLDDSQIICVGLRGSDGAARAFHSMAREPARSISGAWVGGADNEREMLLALRCALDGQTDGETALVGHNIMAFDLNRLRNAYLRNQLRLPACLADAHQAVFDSMREYGRRFSADSEGMISLSDVCARLGVPCHKGVLDGQGVPELFAQKQSEAIVTYCLLDVCCEAEVFLRMTGQSLALQ